MVRKTVLILLFLSVAVFYASKKERRLDWDVFGYYLYLPAHFIYDDLNLEKKDIWLSPIVEKYNTTDYLYQAYKGPKDIYVMKYSMGLSIIYAPFFFIADFAAPILGYERDGFSPPYQTMMMICALFFSLVGIYYLFKILSLYFNSDLLLITSALLIFGTNYFVMSGFDGLMPHNFVFTLYAIMLYSTIKWYKEQRLWDAIVIGICFGFSVLIRPTSIIVIIIPLLWNVSGFRGIKDRLLFIYEKRNHLLIVSLVVFLIALPQLIYWKTITGNWIFYSYPDEKVNLLNPHLPKVLFSYKKGWLLYTPLIAFAIIGFVNLYKQNRGLFFPIFLFFLFNTYIISCWDCWWYGGSFGQRPFVESYVFMAFPLATFIKDVANRKRYVSLSFFILSLALISLNIFQTKQAIEGVIHTTLTTKEYYWRVFLKDNATEEDRRWLQPAQYADGKDVLNPNVKYDTTYSSSLVLDETAANLNEANVFSKNLLIPNDSAFEKWDHYLLVTAIIDTLNTTDNLSAHLVAEIRKAKYSYKYRSLNFNNADVKNDSGRLQTVILIPPQAADQKFEIKTYVKVDGNSRLKLNSLKAQMLKPLVQ